VSGQGEAQKNKSASLKISLAGAKGFIHASVARHGLFSFQPGFYWLLGYIVMSLAIARFIFWSHSWNFSWMPAGQANFFFMFFVVVHLFIGPFCILFCDAIQEIKNIRRQVPCRPLRVFLKDFINEHFTAGYLQKGAIVYCLVYATLISYTNLKAAIPLLNHNDYDPLLYRWDSSLLHVLSLGGFITIPKYSTVSNFFDMIYFQMWTLACVSLALSFRDRAVFWRYTMALCLAFGLSIPISVFFPSLGPAFWRPGLFSYISNTNSAEVMNGLWKNYLSFKTNPFGTSIGGGNGIVAMPSLHIALVYLSVVALEKRFAGLRYILRGILALFVITTVYLGWHYLSDGVAGLLLGWLAYRISACWFYEKKDREALNTHPQNLVHEIM